MKRAIFFVFGFCAALNASAAGKQLTGQHAPAETPALSPGDAEKAFKVPPGFEVRLFAAEPDVVNPVAMSWDERGRLFVLELYEYPLGAPEGQKPRDRIKILEDTDNDGRADKITIFADGLNLATGLLVGDGGVYVGQAPDLLFLEDTDGDDKADKRTVLLTGFGLHDRHELLNGFTWGPDGWLYMTHGVFTASKVKIPEGTTPGIEMNAAVARFDPRSKKFEIYADGTSNPWGVDFDKYGNAFVSACVIDHLFHMTPGGIYVRQGGVPGNPYSYELLPSIVDHKHHMAAYCGICIYQGDMFPEEFQGRVFMGNIHQNAINHDRLIPNGSSFKAVPEPDFLTTSDGWFRPVSEQVGPDGALWIADWYDKYPCYQNAQADPEGVDRERGRIWRVVYNTHAPGRPIGTRPDANMDLRKMKNDELVKLLEHPNVWQRRTAQKLLNERRHPEALLVFLDQLGAVAEKAERVEGQMAALSILHSEYPVWDIATVNSSKSDLRMPENLKKALASDNANVRAWFARNTPVQLRSLKDKQAKDQASALFDEIVLALERLAADPNPRVRLAVATACRQIVSSSLTVNTDINTNAPIGKILATLIKSSADENRNMGSAPASGATNRAPAVGSETAANSAASSSSKVSREGAENNARGARAPQLDPLIPFMIWMAAEPLVAANPEPHLKWLAENGLETMPLSGILTRKAMRRICDTGEPEKMNSAVRFLTQIASQPEKTASQLPETPSQVAESTSQLKKQPSQVAQPPSQLEKHSSRVEKRPSQVAESPSQPTDVASQPAARFSNPLSRDRREEAHSKNPQSGIANPQSKNNQSLGTSAPADDLLLAALDGLIEGQRAKPVRPTIDTAALFAKNENASPQIKERLQQLATLWGDETAAEKTIASINDPKAPMEKRLQAIQAAKQLKSPAASSAMLKLLLSDSPERLLIEGFQSFSAVGDEGAGKEIVKNWSKFSPKIRRIAAETLTSRSQWTRQLLDGLQDKIISPSDISATAARALFTSKNPNFVGRAEQLLGKFHESDADKLKLIKEKRKVVLQGTPNIERGHELARKTCFVCHKLHGEGAEVGPDLTGVGRSTLDALLANVVDPNQIVGKGYELVEVETKDGRTVNGRLVEESDGHLKLLAAGPIENVISKSDIASKRVSELSLMPEGLEQMPEEDFRDLIWFILSPPQEGKLTPEKRKALVGK